MNTPKEPVIQQYNKCDPNNPNVKIYKILDPNSQEENKYTSEKEEKLIKIQEKSDLNIPPFFSLTSEMLKEENTYIIDANIKHLIRKCKLAGIPLNKLIVRSSHPLEGKEGLPWTGIFESIRDVEPTAKEVLSKYKEILENNFKALRYAKRNGIEDFKMEDMGVIIMPMIDYYAHFMIRNINLKDGIGYEMIYRNEMRLADNILIYSENNKNTPDKIFRQYGKKVNYNENVEKEKLQQILNNYGRYFNILDKIKDIFGGKNQEIEICQNENGIFILQSRDINQGNNNLESPDNIEIPNKELPVYVINETLKEPCEIINELLDFCSRYDEYYLIMQDINKTSEDLYNSGKRELIYSKYIEEATVSFVPDSDNSGDMHLICMHYDWAGEDFRCFRKIDINNKTKKSIKKIRNGLINPLDFYKSIS